MSRTAWEQRYHDATISFEGARTRLAAVEAERPERMATPGLPSDLPSGFDAHIEPGDDEPEMGGAGFERYLVEALKWGATRESALRHWATVLSPESRATWNAAPVPFRYDPPSEGARELADQILGYLDSDGPDTSDDTRADALAMAFVDVAERVFPGGLEGGGTTGIDFRYGGAEVRVVAMQVPPPKEPG